MAVGDQQSHVVAVLEQRVRQHLSMLHSVSVSPSEYSAVLSHAVPNEPPHHMHFLQL